MYVYFMSHLEGQRENPPSKSVAYLSLPSTLLKGMHVSTSYSELFRGSRREKLCLSNSLSMLDIEKNI